MAKRKKRQQKKKKKQAKHQDKYSDTRINQNSRIKKSKNRVAYISGEEIGELVGNGTRFWKMSEDGIPNRD